MPVDTIEATRWEEEAAAQYWIDPDTGLPTGSVTSPVEVAGPDTEFLGSTSFSLDGSLPKWLTPSDGTTIIKLSARGGEVYYEINAVGGASATSPGYIPDGQTETIGPLCNMQSLWVFSATADTVVHATFWREKNTSLAGSWTTPAYWERVMALNPIAYWPLWETSGTVAHCLVNPAQNGTYSSDVSTWPVGTGIGDGNTAPQFDGANDRVVLTTATLLAAINGSTGAFLLWYQVDAGTWTDGVRRYHIMMRDGGYANLISLRKSDVNNRLWLDYRAGGVAEAQSLDGRSATTWQSLAITWDKPGEIVRYYENGLPVGTDDTLGVWAGITGAWLGADNNANRWDGLLAHCVLWNRVLTPDEIAVMATV